MTDSTALATTEEAQNLAFRGIVNIAAMEQVQRVAKLYSSSNVVPREYQGQAGFPNACVAVSRAWRLGIDPGELMQNSYVIHGRVVYSSQFIIAIINGCGRFSPLRYQLSGQGESLACYAVAKDLASGQELKGPTITMAMAKKEGWVSKTGSKWLTMPELMIRYRAAAFWGRLYASDMLLGMYSQEEVVDIEPVSVTEAPAATVADLNAAIAQPAPAPEPAPEPESDELF